MSDALRRVRIGDVEVDLASIDGASPDVQLQARLALQEIEKLQLSNPLQFYRPASAKHLRFHEAQVRLRAIQGGNRSGKTTTAIVDDLIQAVPRELLSPELQEFKIRECPFYCRVMTPDMERTMKPVIHKKIAEWIPKTLLKNGSFANSYDRQANSLHLECGCRFDFLSYEMSIDKFGGADLHRCHYDEEPPEDIREECLMRLVDYGGDEVFSFTPLRGLTWAYRTLYKNRDDPRVHLEQVSMVDNPHLNQNYVQELLEGGPLGLSDVGIQRRVEGVFTAEHGFCYPSIRDWVCEPPTQQALRQASEIIVGIDPGYRVCGLTFTANMRSEAFLTFDTLELTASDASQYADAIGRVLGRWGIPPDNVVFAIDPNNARAKNLVTGESVEDELIRHGIYPEHGQKDVMAGVMLLNRLGREKKWLISDALGEFMERMEEYPLEEDSHGELRAAKTGREHLCDSVRYALSIRAWPEARDERQPVFPDGVAYPAPKRTQTSREMGPLA